MLWSKQWYSSSSSSSSPLNVRCPCLHGLDGFCICDPSTQLNPKPIHDVNPIQPSPSSHTHPMSSYPASIAYFTKNFYMLKSNQHYPFSPHDQTTAVCFFLPYMKFIRHTGQTIATTVIRTPTVEKKSQGINHTDSNTLSENSKNITFDGGNGHCITNIINEVQGINVISNHIKRQ